ncbi:hypothetical protein LdCL_330015800 [Leishmania donovani]|uniref:Uncharacterized protein n=1 Tax=Leishmania donovani TaxID=5661 RepID=A0A3Q8IHE6_LEIDO|nr:hypothetical protein LdCL_330015800 [Leishmania donovani]
MGRGDCALLRLSPFLFADAEEKVMAEGTSSRAGLVCCRQAGSHSRARATNQVCTCVCVRASAWIRRRHSNANIFYFYIVCKQPVHAAICGKCSASLCSLLLDAFAFSLHSPLASTLMPQMPPSNTRTRTHTYPTRCSHGSIVCNNNEKGREGQTPSFRKACWPLVGRGVTFRVMNGEDSAPLLKKAALRSDDSARSPSEAGSLTSWRRLSSRLGTQTPSSITAAALALTSNQRLFSEATLRSIALLLRHTAAQIEAAALQDAMEDPVASEYIMTSGGRAEEHNVSTASVSVPVASFVAGDADRSALSSRSSSGSGADWVSGMSAPSSAHGAATRSTVSPSSHSQRGSKIMAQVPSTLALPSSAPPDGSRHSRCSPPLLELRRRPRASFSGTFVDQAIRAAGAAASSPSYSYSFPEKWFGPPADALALNAAQRSAADTLLNSSTKRASMTASKGFRPRWQPRTSSSKFTFARDASLVAASRSQSLNTAVFLPDPSPARSPAPVTHRNSSSHADWNKVLAVATSQPPLFFDNLLFDPATNRYLFGGHAFREEVRVLQAPAADASVLAASRADDAGSGDSVTKHPRGSPSPWLLLVREYIPVSAECSIVGDEQQPLSASGGSVDAVVVQCFSLLPPQLAHLRPNPYQLLPESTITMCLLVALPGCVTLATPLDVFLHDMRHSLLMVAGSSLGHLLGSSQETTKEVRRGPGSGTQLSVATVSPSASTARVSFLRPSTSLKATSGKGVSVASSSSAATPVSLGTAERDRDATRIAIVEERLAQIVMPDILDEAMHAIYGTLVVYCIQYEQRRRMLVVVGAVHVLQRFFRRCLAVMERAVRRMVRLWRQLEVDARLKLQQYRPLPTALERLDAVANSILQDHMLTSVSYKRSFIAAQWAVRRRSFAQWRQTEEWDSVFASHVRRKEGNSNGTAADSASEKRPRSARLSAGEELRLESEFNKRRGWSSKVMTKCAEPSSPSTTAESYAEREQAAIRRFLSWYIDPQELLYLSHQRLLETLKGSVFQMADVQLELRRAANRLTKEDCTTPLAASMSCNSVHQRR